MAKKPKLKVVTTSEPKVPQPQLTPAQLERFEPRVWTILKIRKAAMVFNTRKSMIDVQLASMKIVQKLLHFDQTLVIARVNIPSVLFYVEILDGKTKKKVDFELRGQTEADVKAQVDNINLLEQTAKFRQISEFIALGVATRAEIAWKKVFDDTLKFKGTHAAK